MRVQRKLRRARHPSARFWRVCAHYIREWNLLANGGERGSDDLGKDVRPLDLMTSETPSSDAMGMISGPLRAIAPWVRAPRF